MRATILRSGRALIGPPHPISNIRPVLYDPLLPTQASTSTSDTAPSSSSSCHPDLTNTSLSTTEKHPYAVDEFNGSSAREATPITPASKDEWVMRWTNVENDRANHLFWLDSNTRFNAAKQALVESYAALPQSPNQTKEDREVILDQALARFYRGWQEQEEQSQKKYTREMYSRTWNNITMAFWSQRWVAKVVGR